MNTPSHTANVCRACLGFLFIYHRLFPKILWLSPVEVSLMEYASAGIPAAIASPIAGAMEILFGLSIIVFKNSRLLIYSAAALLIGLLAYAALVMPLLLAEAFNPVTTNIMGLVLCYLTLRDTE